MKVNVLSIVLMRPAISRGKRRVTIECASVEPVPRKMQAAHSSAAPVVTPSVSSARQMLDPAIPAARSGRFARPARVRRSASRPKNRNPTLNATATYSGTPPTQGGSIDLVYHPDGSRGYRMNVAWTVPELIFVSYTGDNCPSPQRIFQPAASALTNGPLEIPAVTTRPFVAFPFDDTFSAGDPGWTYDTTAHVAAE